MAKKKLTYDEMNDEQKANYDKWMTRSENMKTGGNSAMGIGCSMVIIGAVLTAVVAVLLMLIL